MDNILISAQHHLAVSASKENAYTGEVVTITCRTKSGRKKSMDSITWQHKGEGDKSFITVSDNPSIRTETLDDGKKSVESLETVSMLRIVSFCALLDD